MTNHFPFDSSVKVIGELQIPVFLFASKNESQVNIKQKRDSASNILKITGAGLVLPLQGSRLRSEVEEYLIEHRLKNPVFFEGSILAAVVRSAVRGLGVGFFSLFYVQSSVTSKSLVRLGGDRPLWMHNIFLVVSAGAEKVPLIQLLKAQFDALANPSSDLS